MKNLISELGHTMRFHLEQEAARRPIRPGEHINRRIYNVEHDGGRRLNFLGDLVDRGPKPTIRDT